MTEKPVQNLSQTDLITLIEDLISKAERGEPVSAAARYQTRDGEWHDMTIGWRTDEERDTAMAQLRQILGHLH